MRILLVSIVSFALLAGCGGPAASLASATAEAKPSFPSGAAPMTSASWSLDRAGTSVKVAFYALGGHPIGLLLFDPDGKQVAQIPVTGSGMWGPESCVTKVASKQNEVSFIGEATMSEVAFADLESRWRSYAVQWLSGAYGGPVSSRLVPLTDTGCRGTQPVRQ